MANRTHVPTIDFGDLHARADGLRARFQFLAQGRPDTAVGRQAALDLELLEAYGLDMRRQADLVAAARARCSGDFLKAYVAECEAAWIEAATESARAAGLDPLPEFRVPDRVTIQVPHPDPKLARNGATVPKAVPFREACVLRAHARRKDVEDEACRLRKAVHDCLEELQTWLTHPDVFRLEADLRLEEERAARVAREAEDLAREARLKFRAPPRPFVPTKIGEAALAERSDRRALREAEEARRAAEAEAKAKAQAVAAIVAEAMKAATAAIFA